MNKQTTRTAALILAIVFVAALVPFSVYAKNETVTECVNLVNVQKNERGPGWDWANRYDIMTLSNLTIRTDDDYGIRLPADATVVLEGNNYIEASKAAVVCAGTTTFKGDGTLTLVSGDMGIFVNCSNERKTVSIVGGTYNITSANEGIRSLNVPFSAADCTMTISSAKAANCYSLALNGAKIDADCAFSCTYNLSVFDCSMTVKASEPAFSTEKGLISLNKVALTSGGSKIDEYTSQNEISMTGTAPHYTKSVLFGAGVHIWVDYVFVGAIAVIGGLAIFLKIHSQKKRDAERKAKIEAIKASGGDIADIDE